MVLRDCCDRKWIWNQLRNFRNSDSNFVQLKHIPSFSGLLKSHLSHHVVRLLSEPFNIEKALDSGNIALNGITILYFQYILHGL